MIHRVMVHPAKLKSITQGSIFNFARSDDFTCSALGMVISARCDLAQKKQEKFIYVPLAKAKDWIDTILVPKMTEELKKSTLGDLRNILKQNNESERAIDTFGPEYCIDLVEKTKEKTRYNEKLNLLRKITACLDTEEYDKTLIARKALTSRIDEVIANKVEGYFFIDQVIDYQNHEELGSYIAMLGEPRPIHKNTALKISEGLDHSLIIPGDSEYDSISKTNGEMSYILCNLKSPFIELALQRFSNLYSRIGIEDHSNDLKELLTSEVMK